MILGLPFTDEVGFNINSHLAEHRTNLNGLNFDQNDGVQGVPSVRRMHAANGPGDYVPIQMDPRAPLDDADPLEEDAPCLTIGQVDPKEEESLIIAMKNRAYDAINSYRADSYYRVQIPNNAEAQIDYLINEYRSVFSSKLTGRQP